MYITLYRSLPDRPTRYYTIHNRQGNLFTPYSLTVSWGASVSGGTERLLILESRKEFDERVRMIVRRKLHTGYQVLYCFLRSDESRVSHLRSFLNRHVLGASAGRSIADRESRTDSTGITAS